MRLGKFLGKVGETGRDLTEVEVPCAVWWPRRFWGLSRILHSLSDEGEGGIWRLTTIASGRCSMKRRGSF